MRKRLHVIPVPDGMTPEDAFAEINVFGHLAENRIVEEDGTGGHWAVYEEEIDEESD